MATVSRHHLAVRLVAAVTVVGVLSAWAQDAAVPEDHPPAPTVRLQVGIANKPGPDGPRMQFVIRVQNGDHRCSWVVSDDPTGLVLDGERFNDFAFGWGRDADWARDALNLALRKQVEALDRVCHLNADQEAKLQLAARGDIRHYFDRVEETRRRFGDRKYDVTQLRDGIRLEGEIRAEILPLRAPLTDGLFGADSTFAKTLRTTLSAEQLDQYEKSLSAAP